MEEVLLTCAVFAILFCVVVAFVALLIGVIVKGKYNARL